MYAREEGAGLVLRWQVELRQRFFAVKHAARPFETRVVHQVVADIDRRIVEVAARHVFAVQRRQNRGSRSTMPHPAKPHLPEKREGSYERSGRGARETTGTPPRRGAETS